MTSEGPRPSGGGVAASDRALAPVDASQLRPGAAGIRELLERSKSQIAAALPKHLTVERILRVAMTAVQTTPKLAECTPLSVLGGIVLFAQLGLEIGGPMGHAYLVPYKKSGQGREPDTWIATPIPGYRGMVDLARRSGAVSTIEAHVVHKRDRFRFAFGLHPVLEHVPYAGEDDPGNASHAYAICRLRDGSTQYDVLTRREVEHVRKRSQAAGSEYSPWTTDPDEMWKKTAIRRLWKLLPASVEKAMEKAIVAHDRAEMGNPLDASGVLVEGSDLWTGAERAPDGPAERRTTKRAAPERSGPPIEGEGYRPPEEADRGRAARPDDAERPKDPPPPTTKRGELIAWLSDLRKRDLGAFAEAAQMDRLGAGVLDLAATKTEDLEALKGNAEDFLRRHSKIEDPPYEGGDGREGEGRREPGDDLPWDRDPPPAPPPTTRRTGGRR